jgi:hypothetical protein
MYRIPTAYQILSKSAKTRKLAGCIFAVGFAGVFSLPTLAADGMMNVETMTWGYRRRDWWCGHWKCGRSCCRRIYRRGGGCVDRPNIRTRLVHLRKSLGLSIPCTLPATLSPVDYPNTSIETRTRRCAVSSLPPMALDVPTSTCSTTLHPGTRQQIASQAPARTRPRARRLELVC